MTTPTLNCNSKTPEEIPGKECGSLSMPTQVQIEAAAKALIADVRRRYPGEELRCPYMIALDGAITAAAEVGSVQPWHTTEDWERARDEVFDNLRRLGYEPDGTSFAESNEELLKKSAQWRLRQIDQNPVSFEEVEWALMEALVYQGWCRVWRGDGLSCAAQIVWAQHQRAEKIEAATIERCAQVAETHMITRPGYATRRATGKEIAARIRALKDKP